MDPLNPIIPGQGFLAPVTRAPAVPRVSPDEQRDRTRDERQPEQDAEDEDSFEHMLEDVAEDGLPAPAIPDAAGTAPALPEAGASDADVIADAVMVAGGSLDTPQLSEPGDWDGDRAGERRAEDEAPGPDDDEGPARHIDISA